ncbi:uncharacterized protein LOC112597137, partial [Melanaphis sacchari]|uniref:uncharacterized protein LOC112597137 n=1 Tax=Melanaphis sacchari TaxID=742174 RepID=UPI000DC12F6B
MNTILDFLKSRNIHNAYQVAREMDSNKVDRAVISISKEDDPKLRYWLPGYGDRMALINWSQQNHYKKNKNNYLLDKLKYKVKNEGRRSFSEMCSSDETVQPLVKTFKGNAFKSTRTIQIGWLHFDQKINEYKQIKESSGGGVRSIQCPKDSKPDDLLQISKEL